MHVCLRQEEEGGKMDQVRLREEEFFCLSLPLPPSPPPPPQIQFWEVLAVPAASPYMDRGREGGEEGEEEERPGNDVMVCVC